MKKLLFVFYAFSCFFDCLISCAFGQTNSTDMHMVYVPSHRATFEQEWKYVYPGHRSNRWFIALRYAPELPWSKDVECKAELLTSEGWIPFTEAWEGSPERRRMLVMDHPHHDPLLKNGFTVRTTITATISHQSLEEGKPSETVPVLSADERKTLTSKTEHFDFDTPSVKQWMRRHDMWIRKDEPPVDFALRVYRELRRVLPYNGDGGGLICSEILKAGYGECSRHAMVGTAILRANKIPARMMCALWAGQDGQDFGAHCWVEFYLDGVGWVPFDTTYGWDSANHLSDDYFGRKQGDLIAGMIDLDWVIDAGALGKHTIGGIDAFPGCWSRGSGPLVNPIVETKTRVRVLERFDQPKAQAVKENPLRSL